MPQVPREQDAALERVLESGASLTGATGGALTGALLGGPVGAVVGAGTGWMIEALAKIGADVARRQLSPRSETRIGALLLAAGSEVSARLLAGEVPRDYFRAEVTPGRSQADELVEAALIAASQTHEERKIPYMAHLLASIPFESNLSHADANQLIAVQRLEDGAHLRLARGVIEEGVEVEPGTGTVDGRGGDPPEVKREIPAVVVVLNQQVAAAARAEAPAVGLGALDRRGERRTRRCVSFKTSRRDAPLSRSSIRPHCLPLSRRRVAAQGDRARRA